MPLELELPTAPPAAGPVQTGEVVEVVFWHPRPLPGNDKNGEWDYIIGAVVGTGALVAYTTGQNVPYEWGNDLAWATHSSSGLRFAKPEMVFRDGAEARAYAAKLPRPGA